MVLLMACDLVFLINFETNGGTKVNPIQGSHAKVVINTTPISTYKNHTFLGWYYTSDFKGEKVEFPIIIKFSSPHNKPANRVIMLYA